MALGARRPEILLPLRRRDPAGRVVVSRVRSSSYLTPRFAFLGCARAMSSFSGSLGEILDAAQMRDDAAYRNWIESLTTTEIGLLSVRICFAFLHQLLTETVAGMRKRGREVTFETAPDLVRVDTPVRGAACWCGLQDNKIIVDFFGSGVDMRREEWTAPAVPSPQQMFVPVQSLVLRIAKHLASAT